MRTKFRLAAGAGAAAIIAVAGCSQAAHTSQPAKTKQQAATAKVEATTKSPQAAPQSKAPQSKSPKAAPQTTTPQRSTATEAPVGTLSPASTKEAFAQWWGGDGYKQYARVASELNRIIILDVIQDKDANFESDARQLAADATIAANNPPPIDATDYVAAMRNFAKAGQAAATGSYGQAYNSVKIGLEQMVAFNKAAGLTAASVPSGSQ